MTQRLHSQLLSIRSCLFQRNYREIWEGTPFTLIGRGFSSKAGLNTVFFSRSGEILQVPLTSTSETALRGTVPQGAVFDLYPDRIGDGNLGEIERSVERWFDTSAFVAPIYDSSLCQGADICPEAARRALGNSSYAPLRRDGLVLVDFSFHKEFAFGEEKTLDFQVDLFNAFNHANFGAPNGNIASGTAGRVFFAATARQFQFGFRFSF